MLRLALASLLLVPTLAIADELPSLPTDPRAWVNSRPLSLEELKGKGVVLYFFEEDCPRCREGWPQRLLDSQVAQGQPVVVIGVVSGVPRNEVEAYARSSQINWPLIVDIDRSVETQFKLPAPISLQNIYQTRVVTADGTVTRGDSSNLKGTIETALTGAAWKVPPEEIPKELQAAWMEIELGDYQRALPMLRRPLTSKKDDVKAAAEKLQEVVTTDLAELLIQAKAFADSGDTWEEYKLTHRINEKYRGYPGAEPFPAREKELARDDKVKVELAAYSKLNAARNTAGRGDPASINRAIAMLKTLVEQSPETDAAEEAKGIIEQAEKPAEVPPAE